MSPSPFGSFAKFTLGFLVFVSLSLGITIAVNSYTAQQDEAAHTAATFQALVGQQK